MKTGAISTHATPGCTPRVGWAFDAFMPESRRGDIDVLPSRSHARGGARSRHGYRLTSVADSSCSLVVPPFPRVMGEVLRPIDRVDSRSTLLFRCTSFEVCRCALCKSFSGTSWTRCLLSWSRPPVSATLVGVCAGAMLSTCKCVVHFRSVGLYSLAVRLYGTLVISMIVPCWFVSLEFGVGCGISL